MEKSEGERSSKAGGRDVRGRVANLRDFRQMPS
jgi:hypothetical protein